MQKNIFKYINESDDPNCDIIYYRYEQKWYPLITAIKDIPPDTPLTI